MQVAIVDYSQIDRKVFRLEAEFHVSNFLIDTDCFTGDEIIELEQYNSIYGLNSEGKGYPVLRMNEFNGIFTGKANQYSDKFSDADFALYALKKGDILICRTNGNPKLVGKSALVAKDYPYVYESHLFRIRPNSNLIKSETLAVYLNTSYGKAEIEKFSMQGNQANFSLAKFKELRVPKFTQTLNHNIASIVNLSFSALSKSEHIYQQSNNLLLSELGLNNWQPKHQLTFVKNYSDTEQAERIDAEYFQPKYEAIIKAIKAYKGGWDTLGDLVTVKKSVEVGSGEYLDEGIPFVRVSNISPFEITEEKYISEKLYAEIKQHQPKQGEILFSKDATPGIAHYLDAPPRKMIPSGGILRLKSKPSKINNEYLTLVLNSVLVKEQINRDVGGSIILHWRPDQVKETVIPILAEKKQYEIQTKVIESLSLRKQSKHLLECAKRAVEIAIEKDEKSAIAWLKKQTGSKDAD